LDFLIIAASVILARIVVVTAARQPWNGRRLLKHRRIQAIEHPLHQRLHLTARQAEARLVEGALERAKYHIAVRVCAAVWMA
jgi:hypothetical protein